MTSAFHKLSGTCKLAYSLPCVFTTVMAKTCSFVKGESCERLHGYLQEDNDQVSNFPEMYILSFSEFSGFIRCKTTLPVRVQS